jgi:proteic killer suppression protein
MRGKDDASALRLSGNYGWGRSSFVVRRSCHNGFMTEEPPPDATNGVPDEPSRPLYRDKRTLQFASGERVKAFEACVQQAKKRLTILNAAVSRNGLMLLPSNPFEALGGERKGQFSIRIDQQWRTCSEWPDDHDRPFNIEITGTH